MLRLCKRSVVQVCLGTKNIDTRFRGRVRTFVTEIPDSLARARLVLIRIRAFVFHPDPGKLVRWVRRIAKNRGATQDARRGLVRYDAPVSSPNVLHLSTPGDFLLMGRERWHELRGFPELPTHSVVDLYMVFLASAAGLKQLVLPYRIYHQEHDRSQHSQRPLTVLENIPAFREMQETRRPVITNREDWGLGDVELPESQLP